MFVSGDGEPDGADTGVEVEDLASGDVRLDSLECHFVDGEINLEEAVGGVGVCVAEDSIGELREDRVGLVVLIEATFYLAGLITAEEEGLVAASFVMILI